MKGNVVILLAAGKGTRMGAGINKTWLSIGGKTILQRSLEACEKSGCFEHIYLVCREEERQTAERIIYETGVPCSIVVGGKERQDSVLHGIRAVPKDIKVIAIHDAARCFATPELIQECVKSAERFGSGVAGRRAIDTVKQVKGETIVATLDRDKIVLIETPQVFQADMIRKAYEEAARLGISGTDDASLVERMGICPRLVLSKEWNMKMTLEKDLALGAALVGGRTRIGQGWDTHRLEKGRKLVLGGVEIEHEAGLVGHSDADVVIHAVIDALHGAANLPDIGECYPDSDPMYQDIDSMKLLKDTRELLGGAQIGNIDITIIAQRPKLKPYKEQMVKKIAACLKIEEEDVHIKAKTAEGLGPEGREEAISAYAVCLVTLP